MNLAKVCLSGNMHACLGLGRNGGLYVLTERQTANQLLLAIYYLYGSVDRRRISNAMEQRAKGLEELRVSDRDVDVEVVSCSCLRSSESSSIATDDAGSCLCWCWRWRWLGCYKAPADILQLCTPNLGTQYAPELC